MKWTLKEHVYERPGCQMHSLPVHLLVLMPADIAVELHSII